MAGSTISNLVTISVIGGSGSYPSPLTITAAGTIDPTAGGLVGATGLVAVIGAGYFLNQGVVAGGAAASGGLGVDLANGRLTNQGRIVGGAATSSSGVGGIGAKVTAGASLTNSGTISGGNGASYADFAGGPGGNGGLGLDLANSSLTDAGVIAGGNGGGAYGVSYGVAVSGTGGTGIDVISGNLDNSGTIAGGAGGYARSQRGTATGGEGGDGVSISAGSSLTNAGMIAGGAGGAAASSSYFHLSSGGAGGAGVDVSSSSLTNTGTITGGYGGFVTAYRRNGGNTSGSGGVGVSLAAAGTLTNSGTIAGGGGGNSSGLAGPGGTGVDVAGSSLTNTGRITGGAGGANTYSPFPDQGNGFAGGSGGIGVDVSSGSLANTGTIAGGIGGYAPKGDYGGGGDGVDLSAGSSLTNTGAITGGGSGGGGRRVVPRRGGSGVAATDSSLTNDATITGGYGLSGGYGVAANSSTVTNNGTIIGGGFSTLFPAYYAYHGTGVDLTSGALTNTGTILGGLDGVVLFSGGLVSNAATGMIAGYDGVFVNGAGTVINAGTIIAGSGSGSEAVSFGGTDPDRLIVDPGAVFVGSVVAHGSLATLELASAASAGTITDVGTSFAGFGTIGVDTNATWVVTGSVSGSGTIDLGAGSDLILGGAVTATSLVYFTATAGVLELGDPAGFATTVYGFRPGDAFDFTSVTSAGSITAGVNSAHELTLISGGTLLTEIKLDPAQSFVGDVFHAAPDGHHGTLVTETPICFLPGTLIATPAGEAPIEQLAAGDLVLTAYGTVRPIVWVGTSRVLATRGQRGSATPIVVRKGALADNVPHQDLRVTKAHSLYLDGVLVPVEFLVNHRSIHWDDVAQEVTLYHVELATHDVLLANGAPAESYRDDGNRWLFRNASSGRGLPPQPPFAAVLTGGPVVDAAWHRLLKRAGGPRGLPLTDDPDLHLLVDGRRLDAASQRGAWHVYHLISRPRCIRVASRAGAPQELGLARDPRCLGVALQKIMLRRGVRVRTIAADDARLTEGFYGFEPDNGIRWTNGDAVLPTGLFDDFDMPCEIVLLHNGRTSYVDDGTALPRVA